MRTQAIRPVADWIGVASSLLCAIHCLIVPIALVMGPIGPMPHIEDEVFHRLLIWVVVPAAVVAFGIGCLDHKDKWVALLGTLGLVTMTGSLLFLHDAIGESGERIAATLGAALLIAAHARNFQLCRTSDCRHDCRSASRPQS